MRGIRGYQRFLSPLFSPACRFHPSCSEYAATVIARDGIRVGGRRALSRMARCHPFGGPAGIDLP